MEIPISWNDRVRILQQVACALAYLHSASPPCIHRDIKRCIVCNITKMSLCTHFAFSCSSNIILDSSLKSYIADFGVFMAMALHFGATCMVTSAASISLAGTRSYLEFISGKVGPTCDVYSYGIVSVVYYAA